MMNRKWIDIAAFVIGVVLGPTALASAKAAQPPIDWQSIQTTFVGCVIGSIFVIGIQVLRKDPKYGRYALGLFKPLSILVLGAGVGAATTDAIGGVVSPASFFFAVIGVGLLIGVLLSWGAFRAKCRNAL
jgi:hypothetical protein